MPGRSLVEAYLQLDDYHGEDKRSARVNAADFVASAGGRAADRKGSGPEGKAEELILSAGLRTDPEAAPAA